VIVQASAHGTDNTATIDAMVNSNGKARGVAVVKPSIDVGELKEMDKAGMRAVRFNFLPRLVDATPHEVFLGVAKKIEPLGWHTVVYFEAPSLPTITPFLKALPTTIVLDHMSPGRSAFRPKVRPMTMSCRSRGRLSSGSRIACSGAPTGRIPT
jgi:2-pyrone-4,6-dicarboxylate lactonase